MKFYWIKERQNPQLGIYFVALGQLSKAAAKRSWKTLYGENTLHSYATKGEYLSALSKLRSEGKQVVASFEIAHEN